MSKSAPCSDRTCLNQTVGLVVFNSFPDGMTLVGGGGKHSIFAKVFISLLEENTGVLNTTQLFSELQPKVSKNAKQTPRHGKIRYAGHDGGDFLFVRK